jgi:hypothetical protein
MLVHQVYAKEVATLLELKELILLLNINIMLLKLLNYTEQQKNQYGR